MIKQLLTTAAIVMSAFVTNAYACQEDGCQGFVYGPVSAVLVDSSGGTFSHSGATPIGQPYLIVLISDTVTNGQTQMSGSDDAACLPAGSVLPTQNWQLVAPYGGETAEESKAWLDLLGTAQASAKDQVLVITYTWDSNIGACRMIGAGYANL